MDGSTVRKHLVLNHKEWFSAFGKHNRVSIIDD